MGAVTHYGTDLNASFLEISGPKTPKDRPRAVFGGLWWSKKDDPLGNSQAGWGDACKLQPEGQVFGPEGPKRWAAMSYSPTG